MPVYDALYDGGVEHVLCRHEQGQLWRQSAMHEAGQRTGVCIATSGQGQQTLSPGLADALLDSVPVVAITGQSRFITDWYGCLSGDRCAGAVFVVHKTQLPG